MFKSKILNNKVFAVFDISSSSVAGGHVLSQDKNSCSFLASARLDAPLQDDLNIDRFVSETIKNFNNVISIIKKADVHKPTFLQVVLASPWYSSQTRLIFYKKEKGSFICTQKIIDDLVSKEVEFVLSNNDTSFNFFDKESVIIEKQISQIKLNGYHTNSPFGKKAESIEIFLTMTISPKKIINLIKDLIIREYGTIDIGFTTSPYTTFIVTRDNFKINGECMIVDIGEEITDVAFVKNDLFLYQHSFPIGTYSLYRQINKNGGGHNSVESKALLESYRLNKLSDNSVNLIDKSIVFFKNEWQENLQKVLENGHYGFCIPKNCFLISDQRFEMIFTNVIKNDPFIQHTCSSGLVNPFFINQDSLKDKVKSIDDKPVDIPLAVAALFVERII